MTNRFLLSPRSVMVAMCIAILALAIAIAAGVVAVRGFDATTKETQARITAEQGQTALLRNAFCGFVQPIAVAADPPNPPPITKTGVAIIDGTKHTSSVLDCSIDPYDNK
jgi:hypothetical protein